MDGGGTFIGGGDHPIPSADSSKDRIIRRESRSDTPEFRPIDVPGQVNLVCGGMHIPMAKLQHIVEIVRRRTRNPMNNIDRAHAATSSMGGIAPPAGAVFQAWATAIFDMAVGFEPIFADQ